MIIGKSMYAYGLQRKLDSNKQEHYYNCNGEDGIIYVGGGKYWVGIITGIRLLRKYGCELPVEIWYRGSCEEVYPEELEHLGNVRLIDLDAVSDEYKDNRIPKGKVQKGGWEAKLYALMHTSFSRVLYLDADAYCVNDPTESFKLLKSHDFVYWHDLDSHLHSIKWEHVYPDCTGFQPIQGGQLLIDRVNAWRVIHLAHYICQNSKYYFRFMFGDQDAWRVACAALNHRGLWNSYFDVAPAEWNNVAFVCHYDGYPLVVHRCRSKLFEPWDIPVGKVNYSNPQYYLPKEVDVFNEFARVMHSRTLNHEEVFEGVYYRKLWGAGSGAGSVGLEAAAFAHRVNAIFEDEGWKRIVDAGCGDGYVSTLIHHKSYVGYDCCESMIDMANKTYKTDTKTFIRLDILNEYAKIQEGDCIVCKDVLHHWSNADITRFIKGLLESKKWKALILSIDRYQLEEAQDTYTGGYRALNKDMYPLNQFPFKLESEWEGKAILRLNL